MNRTLVMGFGDPGPTTERQAYFHRFCNLCYYTTENKKKALMANIRELFKAAQGETPERNLLQAPEIPVIQPGNLVSFELADDEKVVGFWASQLSETVGSKPLYDGTLFLDQRISDPLGIPHTITYAFLIGINTQNTVVLGDDAQVKSTTNSAELVVRLPLGHMGPVLHPQERELCYTLRIPAVSSLIHSWRPDEGEILDLHTAISKIERVYDRFNLRELAEVNNWPGKDSKDPITLDDIYATLDEHTDLVIGGLRGRYWMHPETGILFRNGKPQHILQDRRDREEIHRSRTVWDAVADSSMSFVNNRDRKQLERAAAFWYWGKKLGLSVPRELQQRLQDLELMEFN
ncbi:MAG: hypothetical protein UV59_C0035G0002 [Candidatus Gottesmanbacteria bacterium GW2011_GWA1_43_11]|uniref:Uncharacterized protein n=1 Tax=Candidatus Gottesmanbacteria bacterium GW2011_GWA1_43_11 TaxID=1618436 RepID=A0A0G1CD91_9BACT|nr:MAG: hypothetical protein UV59_C0035G0002 [Candidatus Gottesmanbacteria bacterium GW2011_GWA1_43_11]